MGNDPALKLSSEQLESLENNLNILEAELKWRIQNERISFYEPNLPIQDTIKNIGEHKENKGFIYTLSAANGIGKTTGIINIIGNLVFGPQNKYFKYPIFENWPYIKRIRIVTEPSQVKDSGPIPTEIRTWWPKGRYQESKAGHPYISEYKANGWIVEVMTYEQHRKQHEGANCGLILFNEPPPADLWTPNISRLRNGGFAVVAMTPLTEAGWFFDDVIPRHERFVVYADVETACKQHGTNGHLDHEAIERMIAEYSEEEKEARVGGKAMYLKGLIFKTFFPNVHVLKENVRPQYNHPIWQVVDPHSDKPFACIWAFPDSRGDLYIFDEWPNEDFYRMHSCQLTIEDYRKIFRDKEAGFQVEKRIIDRHFADTSSPVNKRTLRQELQGIGLNFHPSYTAREEIDTGIEKVRRYLAFDPSKPISSVNQPRLYIAPKCHNTIKSLSKWARDPNSGKVKDEFKDFCDVVRYLCVDSPSIADEIPETEYVKRY